MDETGMCGAPRSRRHPRGGRCGPGPRGARRKCRSRRWPFAQPGPAHARRGARRAHHRLVMKVALGEHRLPWRCDSERRVTHVSGNPDVVAAFAPLRRIAARRHFAHDRDGEREGPRVVSPPMSETLYSVAGRRILRECRGHAWSTLGTVSASIAQCTASRPSLRCRRGSPRAPCGRGVPGPRPGRSACPRLRVGGDREVHAVGHVHQGAIVAHAERTALAAGRVKCREMRSNSELRCWIVRLAFDPARLRRSRRRHHPARTTAAGRSSTPFVFVTISVPPNVFRARWPR